MCFQSEKCKKKELEKFIFENVTVAWHPKVVDQCDEYPYEDSDEGDLFKWITP